MRRSLPLLSVTVLVFAATAPAAEVDKYLLDDTDAVLGVNVKMLVASPLFKANYLPVAKKQIQSNADGQKQLQAMSFDPLRDVDRVLLVHSDSCHRMTKGKDEFLPFVIVRGRFDTAKIQTQLATLAQFAPTVLKIHKEANGLIYELTVDRTIFVALPDRTTLVASMFKDQVSEALDKGRNKKQTKLKHFGMHFLIEQIDYKHTIWVAALGRAAFAEDTSLPTAKDKKVEKGARKKLSDSGIRELSGGVAVSNDLRAAFRIKIDDVEDAKTIHEVLEQILPQLADNGLNGQVKGKALSPVTAFLKSLTVGREDNELIVRGDVPGKVFVESLK